MNFFLQSISILMSLFVISAAAAETEITAGKIMYVSDKFEITLRTGPGVDRKIISLIRSGQQLEILTGGDEWAQVRLPNEREGWVLTRYITKTQPSAMVIKKLKARIESLVEKNSRIAELNSEFKQENKVLKGDVQVNQQKLKIVNQDFVNLKKNSSGYIKLKTRYDDMLKKLKEATEKADKFEDETLLLSRNKNVKWFLGGAGVLLLGFIIGFSSKRRPSRSSLR